MRYTVVTEEGSMHYATQQEAESAAQAFISQRDAERAAKEKVAEFATADGSLRAVVIADSTSSELEPDAEPAR